MFFYVYIKDFIDDVNIVLYVFFFKFVLFDFIYRLEIGGKKKGGLVDLLIRGFSVNVLVL